MEPGFSEAGFCGYNRPMFERLRQIGKFLLSLEIWLVGGALAASIIVPRLLLVVVILSAGFWIVRWAVEGRLSRRTPVDPGVGLLTLMLPVTLWVTAWPEITTIQVYRLLTGIFLFYAFVNWMDSAARMKWSLWGVIAMCFTLSLGAVFGVEWAVDKIPIIPAGIYQVFKAVLADTANPNVLAGSLVLVFPFGPGVLIFVWKQLSRIERLLAALIALVSAGVLVLSQSRSALMALLVVLAILLILRWKWGWLFLLLLLLSGILYIGILEETTRHGILSMARASLKWDQRLEIWSRAVFMIRDFPFTGIGMGSFRQVAEWFYPFSLPGAADIPHAHNLFLQIAVDLGIPGLVAWLSILVAVIAVSWKTYRRGIATGNRWVQAMGASLFCSQAALIAHGMTDAVTWGMVRPAPVVWALWGIAIATWNLQIVEEAP